MVHEIKHKLPSKPTKRKSQSKKTPPTFQIILKSTRFIYLNTTNLSSWWFQPLCKVLVKMVIFNPKFWGEHLKKVYETTTQLYLYRETNAFPVPPPRQKLPVFNGLHMARAAATHTDLATGLAEDVLEPRGMKNLERSTWMIFQPTWRLPKGFRYLKWRVS